MSLITTETNLDTYITALQLHYGDIDGTAYSEAVYRTCLVNGVRYLSRKWNNKYYIDSDNNIARNSDVPFTTDAPPIVLPEDEYALILAATVILRGLKLNSSSSSFTSWQTPDLSVNMAAQERTYATLYKQAIDDLDNFFSKGLGRSIKRFNMRLDRTYPIAPGLEDTTPGAMSGS